MRVLLLGLAVLLLSTSAFAQQQLPSLHVTGSGTALTVDNNIAGGALNGILQFPGNGVFCNGVTDDTTAINTKLATLSNGGTAVIAAGTKCLINSANLVIPANVTLQGAGSPLGVMDLGTRIPSAGILLNPLYTIKLAAGGGELRNLSIQRTGLVANPTDAQAIAAVLAWGNETSVAVTFSAGGVRLNHLYIEGFNTAITGNAGNYIISDVVGDDYNGIWIMGGGDNQLITDARFEPFYCIRSINCLVGGALSTSAGQSGTGNTLQFTVGTIGSVQVGDYANALTGTSVGLIPLGTTVTNVNNGTGVITLSAPTTGAVGSAAPISFGGAWARPGVSFHIGGGVTGWYCVRCFSFMYRTGIIIDGVGIGELAQSDFEWQQAYDPGTNGAGTIGVRLVGESIGDVVKDTASLGYSIEFSHENRGNHQVYWHDLIMGNPDSVSGAAGPNPVAGTYLEGASGTQVTETVGGTVAAGNQASVTINGTTITYTAVTGDGQALVAEHLGALVNRNQTLAAAHIAAYFVNNLISIYAPAATTLTVTQSVTGGGVTLTQGTASASLTGTWGVIRNFWYGGSAVPQVVVGPGVGLPIILSGLFPDNNNGIQGDISIDSTSATHVQLQDIPYQNFGSDRLASCGGGSPSVLTGSNDHRGTLTEGTTATGCSVGFARTWPKTPVCTFSSPNGAAMTGVTVSTTTIVITNGSASGNQYSWICEP